VPAVIRDPDEDEWRRADRDFGRQITRSFNRRPGRLRRKGCFGLGRLCMAAYGFLRRLGNTGKAAAPERPAVA
jgi:hypothetical protein